ncbi:phosphoesterase [Pacificimonas flava]|uniref:Phosphoesterase n=2 Tax=Pacificimonas TaxID=1960290 RepID=A0A219B533_9SPHN|nr:MULTISPECIES: ligase-associated DNA damage response endonuclease PdeM [Pacificimonas]MBZ6379300.1 ligase-associated DNA damage response endonuclease PdeM [Pacificimonas aurantium]OWV33492.1 phosphoesterase [Pacificimonas flava]
MVPLSFCGHELVPLAEGAIYWPLRNAILLADLHLEKASWFAKRGQMLPPYDSLETLQAVKAAIARTEAEEVWCLGDSFHDREGCERLAPEARALLESLTAQTDWTWITGNHDPGFVDTCGGTIADEAEVDGLVLRHEADPADPRPELSGHFHPKLRLRLRGRGVSRRCYVMSETKIILPAFGALTGGLDASSPPILRAVGGEATALVPTREKLLRFPLAA